ncbi:DUF2061 domain-containing protein [Calderihabitans maritimus]|uniref:DUF2061 domain-containing protein n=1 Tax=Calderihabitans maritimus TaxID=1246530 RepID=A0A1Z5HXM5_9FIRM|nr:DUF2061 domain-containing protein [Calderihabitans maritimus]GAW94065.1 hypothetical protein [Calderihabitans maritimus]
MTRASRAHQRALAKAISWRIFATLTTMTIVYLFTGKIDLSIGVGIVEVISKMLLYYLHELIWEKTSWGRKRHPLSEFQIKKELTPEDKEKINQKLKELGYL